MTSAGVVVSPSADSNNNELAALAPIKVCALRAGHSTKIEVPVGLHDVSVSDDICLASPATRVNVQAGKTVELCCGTTLTFWQRAALAVGTLMDRDRYRKNKIGYILTAAGR